MKKYAVSTLLCQVLLFSSMSFAQPSKTTNSVDLAEFAAHSQLTFAVISNFEGDKSGLKAQIFLKNESKTALPAGNGSWKIYFHSLRKINAPVQAGLRLVHIQGDLNAIEPTADFKGLATGGSLEFIYHSGESAVSYTDFLPRAFITQGSVGGYAFANTDTEKLSQFVAPFVTPQQQLRFGGAKQDLYAIATAASRYKDNLAFQQTLNAADINNHIIPTPKKTKLGKDKIQLDATWQIRYAGRLTQEALYLQAQLKQAGLDLIAQPDNAPATDKVIVLSVATASANNTKNNKVDLPSLPESYTLQIDANSINLNGSDNAGTFYAAESLLSLLPAGKANTVTLPQLSIADSPHYSWRGMHYDMSRNFHSKAVTLRLIEQMGHYKLNKLHLHLADDEGWRIEINGLPELTEIGGTRCFDLSEQSCLLTQLGTGPNKSGTGNGYYTREDFIEILKYAAIRHIEIIPEIDMPGHSRAAIKSMLVRYNRLMAAGKKEEAQQYLLNDPADKSQYASVQHYSDGVINVCSPSTYAFAEKVIYEFQQMYRAAGLSLSVFHIGGDEVDKGAWTQSPACNALFLKGEKGVAGVADLKSYFVSKLADITAARGIHLAGWEDGLMYDANSVFNRKQFSNEKVFANAWDNIWEWGSADRAYRLANAGYQVILSSATHLYFDHPHEANAEERGLYWATRYTDTHKVFNFMPDNYYANAEKTREGVPIPNLEALVGRALPTLNKPENIMGIQGQVWSETIRAPEQLEQMIYPRMMALAERAWHKAEWEFDKNNPQRTQAWARFSASMAQKNLPKLAEKGSHFYLTPPGCIIENGKLLANTDLPDLTIEYSLDQGANWQVYKGAIEIKGASVLLRTRLAGQFSRAIKVE